MDERMTLTEVHNRLQRMSVAIGLPNAGRRIKSDEVRWSEELRLLAAAVSAHLAQPAQAVDVEAACVSMYPDWRKFHQHERETFRKEMKQALTRAIGNAQAEGCEHDWSIGYGVPRSSGFIPYCRKCGDPMPSTTQATPNAHE